MARPLLDTPLELLQQIVLSVSFHPGPPTELFSLHLTCKAVHDKLAQSTPDFYTRIFALKFDLNALERRMGYDREVIAANSREELHRRFLILKALRYNRLSGQSLNEALWMGYLMSLENEGRNAAQLLWARVPTTLKSLLRLMRSDEATSHGWPIPTENLSLATATLWYLTSQCSIRNETLEDRGELLDLLRPIVFAGFRYPCLYAPEAIRDTAQLFGKYTASAFCSSQAEPRALIRRVRLFGLETRTCLAPPIAIYAMLNYSTRSEQPLTIPYHLPLNRVEADATNREGPTQEDLIYFNRHCKTLCLGPDLNSRNFNGISSLRHQSDWARACNEEPAYRLGQLTGRWQGSQMITDVNHYASWISSTRMPSPFLGAGRRPIFFTLQEHYHLGPLPQQEGDMVDRTWLPRGLKWHQLEGGIEVFDPQLSSNLVYQTYREGSTAPQLSDVGDIVITGQSDAVYEAAWGDLQLIGRIRRSDGLVVLAAHSMLGNALFRGYLISEQNFVGRSRDISGTQPALLEMPFSLCKE